MVLLVRAMADMACCSVVGALVEFGVSDYSYAQLRGDIKAVLMGTLCKAEYNPLSIGTANLKATIQVVFGAGNDPRNKSAFDASPDAFRTKARAFRCVMCGWLSRMARWTKADGTVLPSPSAINAK